MQLIITLCPLNNKGIPLSIFYETLVDCVIKDGTSFLNELFMLFKQNDYLTECYYVSQTDLNRIYYNVILLNGFDQFKWVHPVFNFHISFEKLSQ